MSDNENLIETIIRGRQVTYFLTTEEDLNNVKSNSLLGDIFAILMSLAVGGLISGLITKSTGIDLQKNTLNVLSLLNYIFAIVALIFASLTIYFYVKTFKTIENIKKSGEVKSFKSHNEPGVGSDSENTKSYNSDFKILKATYWTENESIDITEELRDLIAGNQLEITANNDLKGDPDPGTFKKLSIVYKIDGVTINKEFNEHDKIVIP